VIFESAAEYTPDTPLREIFLPPMNADDADQKGGLPPFCDRRKSGAKTPLPDSGLPSVDRSASHLVGITLEQQFYAMNFSDEVVL
jgi:hypothetical protein